MTRHDPKHQHRHDEENSDTAADQVQEEAEDAEVSLLGSVERRGGSREAAVAPAPNGGARKDDKERPGS
ncbi:hypothetical protein AB0N93_33705 [Streptomyces sp. NPDC091267]|uniref:hypothetical protein n=1 Tax=Streptomyces sp. NPDC091267 TaxID=3155195 RepID=UPI00341F46CF